MTERRQESKDEREGELFRLLVENVQDYAIFVVDPEGRVESWNPGARRLLGYQDEEMIGQSIAVFFTPEDVERGFPQREMQQALEQGRGNDDRWHVRKDGSRFWCGGTMTPLWDEARKLRGFAKIMRDRTEWKRNQDANEVQVRLAAFIKDVGLALTRSDSLPAMLHHCTEAMVRHLNGAFARIWTLDPRDEVLELRASAGLYTHLDGTHSRVPVGRYKIGLIAQERQPHLTNAVESDPRVSDQGWAKREGMVAFAGYPLLVEDRLVGVMAMFARQILSDATLEAMSSVSNGIALGIQRKTAEEGQRRQQEWLRVTLASIGDAVIATDTQGRVTFLNPVAEDLTGWGQDAAHGQPLSAVFPILNEQTRQAVENPVEKVLREGITVGLANHTVLVARDGTEQPIDDSAAPIRDGAGRMIGVVLVFRDVTEQRRAERGVQASEARKAAILEAALDCIITMDHEGKVVEFNPAAERTFGYRRDQVVGRELCQFVIPPSLRDRHRTGMAHYLATGEGPVLGKRIELPALRADGSEFPIELAITRIPMDGPPLFTAYLRDVSERKTSEAKLRDQEQRTRTILESITDAFCTFDRDWRFSYVNREAESLLGRGRHDLLGKDYWEEYPDTLGTDVEWNYRRAVAENTTVAFEFFYPAHDRWYELHAYPSPEGLSVYFRDVGDRKRAEIALRQSEEQLRLLADTIPQLAWMARPDGHVFWYNRRWYEYTGTTPVEMEGWGWQAVHDPVELPTVLERWKASIATGEPFEMVFPLKGADDTFRSFLTRVNPLRDQDGRVLYWFGTNTDVEDQKRTQETLARSEERFRQLADAMPQIVWTARPDGNIDYLNRRWTEFSGLPESASNDGWGPLMHPDDAPPARERWAASVRSGEPFEMEMRLLDRQRNAYRWHLIRTVAVHDESGEVARWFGTGTDVHEQKRAEESSRYLAEASAALAGVVDYESTLQKVANLAVPYFADWSAVDVANDDGTLRRLAVAHQDTDKIRLAHELMKDYPPDPQAPGGAFAVLRTGKPEIVAQITDDMLVRGARDERHLGLIRSLGLRSYVCVPLVVSGNSLGVLTFATAESGRTYTDADLALANDLAHRAGVAIENTQLYQALREADRRKDEFLATLAHELRNPLAPIRNSLQILKMPRVDAATVQRSRDMMERQVHHLVRLVDDLLDVSRVMRGKIELRWESVEIATVVARAVETVQPLVDAQGHELSVRLPTESLPLDADPVRLAQVVGNLLTNAAKYTEPGGRIWVTAERVGHEAVLRVRDTGIGITPEMLPRIFELFMQVDHASTKAQGGLGIGLTLVKNLVEMHNGTVEARSTGLGKGSEFTVRLPISARTVENDVGPDVRLPADPLPPTGHRLLVVDDNQDAADSFAMLLRLQGHEVRVAHSGPAALEIAKGYTPDVVFLDVGMPGMDGYEVARRLRQQPGLEHVVLAALTGWGQQEDRRRTADAGFNHHLVKPPDPKAVEGVLAKLKRLDPR